MKNKTITAIAIALGLAASAHAEIVESVVGAHSAVTVPNNQFTEVTHITLSPGLYQIGGLVNIYQSRQLGQVFAAAAIGMTLTGEDGKVPVYGIQVAQPQVGTVIPLPLAGQRIKFNSTTIIYLSAYSNQTQDPNPTAIAWGFISATRIQ